MSFFLPHLVQFEPHWEVSWCGEVGYGMLGGELVLIRGHWVCGVLGDETARRWVFWKGDRGGFKACRSFAGEAIGALEDILFEGMGGDRLGDGVVPAWRVRGRHTPDLERF